MQRCAITVYDIYLMDEEVFIQCPYCGEEISICVDVLYAHQKYVEDCSVCCRPIQLDVNASEGKIDSVSVNTTT